MSLLLLFAGGASGGSSLNRSCSESPAVRMSASYATTVLADSPVAYWRLGESSGLPQDSSGNGRHTTASGGSPAYSQAGALAEDANTAIGFVPASTPSFSAPDDNVYSISTTGVLSVEFWDKPTSSASDDTPIVSKCNAAGNQYEWVIYRGNSASSAYYINIWTLGGGNVRQFIPVTGATANGAWHHVVVTMDEANHTIVIYVDGTAYTDTAAWGAASDLGVRPGAPELGGTDP